MSGKRKVVFNTSEGFSDLPVSVPCGQCVECRLKRSREWALRCVAEASLHLENCFITLTYSNEHLPEYGGLDRQAFPLFMKRLRKAIAPGKARYFHAGEYGEESGRPHYHACLFGFDFPDKVYWTRRGEFTVWRSELLERLWPFGQSEVGSVSFESASYVARYILKKVLGKAAEDHYARGVTADGEIISVPPEYCTMSRRPGIGGNWIAQYMEEVYPADSVVSRGHLMNPPRFYDKYLEAAKPEVARAVKVRRLISRSTEDDSDDRLAVRDAVVQAKLSLARRGL